MKRRMNLSSDQLVIIGVFIIMVGVFLLSYNYLKSKKLYAFEVMNIKLYDNSPMVITSDEDETFENDDIEDIAPVEEEEEPDQPTTPTVYYTGILEIPKINLKKGFYDYGSSLNNVNRNVTVIETSTMPDVEGGNLILAGHNGNAAISFFGKLYKLAIGDLASVYYKGNKYTYSIVNIYTVEKTGQVSVKRTSDKTALTLITCTENSDHEQTVYIAELQSVVPY